MVAVAKQKSELAVAFGRRLKELREKASLSLAGLGERAGMAYTVIARLERGERVPSLDTLIRLGDALGIKLDDFRSEAIDQPAEPTLTRPQGKRK